MGDENSPLDRRGTHSSLRNLTERSQRTAKFWRSMTDMYGARWLETYGDEPSLLWANQIELLTDEQVKRALRSLLKAASPHPPSLPEFLGYAKNEPVRDTHKPEPDRPFAEVLAARWFMQRAVRFRFVGLADQEEIRARAVELCAMHAILLADEDPGATQQRIEGLLDEMAEDIYPKSAAESWLKSHPVRIDPYYKPPAAMAESEYPF